MLLAQCREFCGIDVGCYWKDIYCVCSQRKSRARGSVKRIDWHFTVELENTMLALCESNQSRPPNTSGALLRHIFIFGLLLQDALRVRR